MSKKIVKVSNARRIEELEQAIAAVRDGAASQLGLEVVIEMLGRDKFQAAFLEHQKRRQTDAESAMAKQVEAALGAHVIKPAEVVGPDALLIVGRAKTGAAEYRVHWMFRGKGALDPRRQAWLGKKAGDVVPDGEGTETTVVEVYDVDQVPEETPAQAEG